MEPDDIRARCLARPHTQETFPFGPFPVCYRLHGKIFAQLYPRREDYKLTLKCTADRGQLYRMLYPGKVVRGYHCPPVQQPYWNTFCPEDLPDEVLLEMLDHAYETVLHSFSKKIQRQLTGTTPL